MSDYTIVESYELPSKGKLYGVEMDPVVQLRSMTTAEEMRRLGNSDRPFGTLAAIIDDCLVTKLPISSYDLCIGDFTFLLHKLRIVTYGSEYRISTTCPWCGTAQEDEISLDDLEYKGDVEGARKCLEFDLPKSKKHIVLNIQTPRMLDNNALRAKELRAKTGSFDGDPAFIYSIQSLIKTVDGNPIDVVKGEDFVKNLPMADTNSILQHAQEFAKRVGLNADLAVNCQVCKFDYKTTFRENGEFFRPTVNI